MRMVSSLTRSALALLVSAAVGSLLVTTVEAAPPELTTMLENVSSAGGHRYNVVDDQGVGMDTAKIISSPQSGYLAVYHHLLSNAFQVRLATSSDLLTWHYVTTLESEASQPTVASLTDGGFLVGYEKRSSATTCGGSGSCLAFRHYASTNALMSNTYGAGDTVVLSRSLSSCHEGTPNIYATTLNPDIGHSVINVGFHYHLNCDVDRQAFGTLTNFSSWTAQPDSNVNQLFTGLGTVHGHVGDRDAFFYRGGAYSLIEAQSTKDDYRTWRPYLFDRKLNALTQLNLKTDGGSTSFGNPTYTELRVPPAGRLGFVSTEFAFSEGAAPGEAGALLYFSEYPTQPLPDATRPRAAISQPADGSTVRRGTTVTINASATDDVGIAKVGFFVNGTLICVSPFPPYSCSWSVPSRAGRVYTLTARAFDTSSNTFDASVKVTSR